MNKSRLLLSCLGLMMLSVAAYGSPIKSASPVLVGGTLVDFEGQAEGTLIDTQYPGLVFSQAPLAGRPQIDVSPFLYGYAASSGAAVLTGSTEGGYQYPTVAGLVVNFDTPVSSVQAYLSDSSPLGDYIVQAFGGGDVLLESVTILQSELGSPVGLYVGFDRATADIVRVQFGPSGTEGDAFSIDDLQYEGGAVELVPVPTVSTWGLLLLTALLGITGIRRRFI